MHLRKTFTVAWLSMLAALGAQPWVSSAQAVHEPAGRPTSARELFEFHSGFWLNLHHFLYNSARARNGLDATRASATRVLADTEGFDTLSSPEQAEWQSALAYYENMLAKRDLLFDQGMVEIANELARAESAAQLRDTKLDPMLVTTLEHAGRVYRRLWWPRHDAANKAWLSGVQQQLALYGDRIAVQESRAFHIAWPSSPVRVDVVAYANWASGYTTENPSHTVVASLDPGNQGDQALEVVFHEVLHTMDAPLLSALRTAFRASHKALPHDPTHVFIFYTAGALTQQALPDHVPYAEKAGLWERVPDFKRALPILRQYWQPYLDGKSSLDEAIAAYAAAL